MGVCPRAPFLSREERGRSPPHAAAPSIGKEEEFCCYPDSLPREGEAHLALVLVGLFPWWCCRVTDPSALGPCFLGREEERLFPLLGWVPVSSTLAVVLEDQCALVAGWGGGGACVAARPTSSEVRGHGVGFRGVGLWLVLTFGDGPTARADLGALGVTRTGGVEG